jgi:hypothetical protein
VFEVRAALACTAKKPPASKLSSSDDNNKARNQAHAHAAAPTTHLEHQQLPLLLCNKNLLLSQYPVNDSSMRSCHGCSASNSLAFAACTLGVLAHGAWLLLPYR